MAEARGIHKIQGGILGTVKAGVIIAIAGSCVPGLTSGAMAGTERSVLMQPEDQFGVAGSFDRIDFPIEAVSGRIELAARAGWIWKDGQTHRVVLERDVDVVLGEHRFMAAAANIWLRKLSSDAENGTSDYQVYAIFEDLRSADGTITMTAKQLPVRGVIRVVEAISMRLDARFGEAPRSKLAIADFVERTDAVYAQRVLGAPGPVVEVAAARPWSSTNTRPVDRQPVDPAIQDPSVQVATDPKGQPTTEPGQADAGDGTNAAAPLQDRSIFHPNGVFSVAIGGRIVIDGATSGDGTVITADGGVTIQYQDPGSQRWIDFKAERVVIYAAGDEPITGVSRLGTGQVEGIYLEGGVFAGDDQWSVRSPRMYLDVANNKALMLDAVFWTTDQKTSMPLYVRADSVRQTAQQEFTAEKAKISNSAFFEPDLTIGISDIKVTLDQEPAQANASGGDGARGTADGFDDPRPGVRVEGKNVTLNAGDVPILWLPGFKGDPSSFPLRQITVKDSNRSGLLIQTRWNALSLLNIDGPPGVDVDLDLDYYAERGLGVGVSSAWYTSEHRGGLFSYLMPDDNGTDVMTSGKRIRRDGEVRGIFAAHDIWEFTDAWTLVSEVSYVSDEAFVPALLGNRAQTVEDYRNRLRLERLSDNTQFTIEASTTLNDFIVPEHLLQSPGYVVNKQPEARFISLAQDLLPNVEPGLLTYSFEARAGVLRLAFSEVAASAYGMTTDSLADAAFGTTATTSLGDSFRAMGLDESGVTRLDTRHELSSRFDAGPIRINPFIVGRATAYDSSFDLYSPGQGDEIRYWGGGGVTLSTTVSKVNDNAQSRFFDVHRLRHIVEPSVTIWGGDSNFEPSDVPIFDDDVEGLIEGTAVRFALDQTWQTKRGGVGRWRDVDVLKVRSEYVWTDEDAGRSPLPQFFSTRPELSNPGEFIGTSAIWQPTEVLAFAGEIVYDLDAEQTARASIGAILEHRPGFTTSIEYREIQPLDATFASLSARYRLTDKYEVNTSLNYNFDRGDFQTFNARVLRRFQIGTLGATVGYNNIRGETSFGFVFRPGGTRGDLPIDSSWGG